MRESRSSGSWPLSPRRLLAGGALALFMVGATGCGDASEAAPDRTAQRSLGNIVEVAQAAGQFSILIRAAQAAGLAETLANDGPFTVFAPTDGAFRALPEGTVDALLADPEALAPILLYHVVPGTLKVADLRGVSELETLQGETLSVAQTPQGITINGTYMLTSDVAASNGMVHVITAVLVPGS
jgi:transforming growth factor-beta-induced protein